ncbi:MAG: hypothetical protein ACM3JG_09140, partial [Thiohalocapsa sp.]
MRADAVAYGVLRLALRLARGGAWRRPRPITVAERIASLPCRDLPLSEPVEIRWSERLVPFIAA